MITKYFVLDGESSAQYGIQMQAPPVFEAPRQKITKVSVPARNGDLVFYEDAFENIKGTLKCFILKEQSFDYLADANRWLMKTGYRKLSFDGDDESYRLAVITNAGQCAVRMYYLDPFEIELDCKPQKYLLSGEIPMLFTSSGVFDCPAYEGIPLLKITGNGTVTLNGKTITISGSSDWLMVDCEIQDAYKGTTNLNGKISCDEFPKVVSGENTIGLSGVTSVEITPRWYTV